MYMIEMVEGHSQETQLTDDKCCVLGEVAPWPANSPL